MHIVTVSRMFGAGGAEVAQRVAASLGWTLLDNTFVERVAERLHTTPALVAAVDERSPSLAERVADALAYGAQELLSARLPASLPPTEQRIVEMTRTVIEDAIAHGPVVVVGRGAQAFLTQRDGAFHVLCTATRDDMTTRIAAREGLALAIAARRVDDMNQERASNVKRLWGREWLAPQQYHLCVNTSWLGIVGAADAVLRALPHTPR